MSGLVSGLQNRVRRFESARNLTKPFQMISERVFFFEIGKDGTTFIILLHFGAFW